MNNKKKTGFFENVMTAAGAFVGGEIGYEASWVIPWDTMSGWDLFGAFALNALITTGSVILGGTSGKIVGRHIDKAVDSVSLADKEQLCATNEE